MISDWMSVMSAPRIFNPVVVNCNTSQHRRGEQSSHWQHQLILEPDDRHIGIPHLQLLHILACFCPDLCHDNQATHMRLEERFQGIITVNALKPA
jgi:hypothetical protein